MRPLLSSLTERIPPIDAMAPARLETALFAAGSFQDTEARFGFVGGVWRTSVGYAGGTFPNPCRGNEGDHLEAVTVEYSPRTISYGQLLELFMCWYCAAPSDQCAAIFVRTPQERRLAQAAVERGSLCRRDRPAPRVLPFKTFIRAENACQKHYLRLAARFYDDLVALYGGEEALLRSTLAARLNGFLLNPSASALHCMPESPDLYGLSPLDLQALQGLAV